MEWDQIETKWTAMTRRVRGDLTPGTPARPEVALRRPGKVETAATIAVKLKINEAFDQPTAMSTE